MHHAYIYKGEKYHTTKMASSWQVEIYKVANFFYFWQLLATNINLKQHSILII